MWRRSATALAALTLLITMAWAAAIPVRHGLADWDIMTFYLPWYAQMGERLRAADIPGWNPYIFSGTSFVGNPQSGWAYLPVMLLFTALPPLVAFAASIWLHLVGSAVATYALARLVGLGISAAFVAGAAYTLTANLGVATCCTNHVQLALWLPLSLVGVELGLRQRTWASQLAALGISAFAFSQMAAGWVGQGTYNGALLLGSYLVWRGLVPTSPSRAPLMERIQRTLISGIWVFGLGAGLAAMGLLPRLDIVRRTYVGSNEYQGATFEPNRGLDWWRVGEILLRFQLDWFPYHLGAGVVSLAVIGIAAVVGRRALVYFAILAVVLVLLPMRPTPLHEMVYLLPRFRNIHLHDPARILAMLPLPVAILAGAGVDGAARVMSSRCRAIAIVCFVAFWGWVFWLDVSKSWELHWTTWVTVALVVIAFAVTLPSWAFKSAERTGQLAPIAAALLITAVVLDPAGYSSYRWIAAGGDVIAETAIERSTSESDPEGAGEFLQERQRAGETFRYLGYVAPTGPDFQAHEHFADPSVVGLLANNRAMRLELDDVQGYDPAQLVRYRALFATLNGFDRDYHEALVYAPGLASPLLNLLGVRYVVVPAGDRTLDAMAAPAAPLTPAYREVFTNGTVRVFENTAALPRAWVVHEARQTSPVEALDLLGGGTVDPRQVALLEEVPPVLQPAAGTESVSVTRYEPDRVTLDVAAASDGLVVLGDVYDPGWNIYVDGERSRMYAVDTIFRGVAVSAGPHTVEFRYEPRSLRVGLMISSVSFLVLIVVAVAGVWSHRRTKMAPETDRVIGTASSAALVVGSTTPWRRGIARSQLSGVCDHLGDLRLALHSHKGVAHSPSPQASGCRPASSRRGHPRWLARVVGSRSCAAR